MIKKILVSQPKPTSEKSPYFDIANRFDVELVVRPFIKVEAITAREFRTQKVSILDYTAIVFTSRHAIDHFFNMAKELRVNIPEDMKYFCVTETIALYIQKYVQYRKRKVFFGETGRVDDLIPTMVKHKTEKYLVPMSDVHNDSLSRRLAMTLRKKRSRTSIMTCSSSSALQVSSRCARISPTSSKEILPLQLLALLRQKQPRRPD